MWRALQMSLSPWKMVSPCCIWVPASKLLSRPVATVKKHQSSVKMFRLSPLQAPALTFSTLNRNWLELAMLPPRRLLLLPSKRLRARA